MDWINKYIKKIRKSLSITMAIYILIAVFIVIILEIFTKYICSFWILAIISRYDIAEEINIYYYMKIISKNDLLIFKLVNIIENWSIFLYSICTIIIVSWQFYKNKLKEPIDILINGARHIANNNLDIECKYESQDEMGEVCKAFNNMRLQLIENNKRIWNIVNEQRCLNSAFAHDLRTPLTVLNGYIDLLIKYFPDGNISEQKLMDMLIIINNQVKRLEKFIDTMKDINNLANIQIDYKKIYIIELVNKIKEITNVIDKNIEFKFINKLDKDMTFKLDLDIVLEICENLISNAIRYANSKIEILINIEDNELVIYISDDGKGFSKEALKNAINVYYTENSDDFHMGIGLYMCKLLCELHKGSLCIENSILGGAIVRVSFN